MDVEMKKDGSGCEDLERNPPYVEQNGCKKLPYNCEQCRRDKTKCDVSINKCLLAYKSMTKTEVSVIMYSIKYFSNIIFKFL